MSVFEDLTNHLGRYVGLPVPALVSGSLDGAAAIDGGADLDPRFDDAPTLLAGPGTADTPDSCFHSSNSLRPTVGSNSVPSLDTLTSLS